MITLRPYQSEAKAAVYEHLRTRADNPCVVIPTAGGKTPLIASICRDAVGQWQGRVLILAHVKELLQQAADKLNAICPEIRFGVYSAGLKRRDTTHPVIIAGIQSVYIRACELDAFDLVLIDEAHRIPLEGDGMYRQFLADAKVVNPNLRIVGFTATPFRLKTGPICTPDGYLNHICYEVGVRELIRDGYLCPLTTKNSIAQADTSRLHVRAGEYVANEVEDLMDQEQLVEAASAEIVTATTNRNAVLIFASGVRHGEHIVRVLRDQHRIECGLVTGQTPDRERDSLLGDFRSGRLKYLTNVNVLSTGFDAPNIDCVALVRPTLSAGLYYQMVGRGFRLHPGKPNCLVLDFGGNVMRHGPVDQIKIVEYEFRSGNAPVKECPNCHCLVATGYARCPECGFEFPARQHRQHERKASDAGILSGEVTTTKYVVKDIDYSVHTKKGADDDAPKSMRVDYKVGFHRYKSEWICFEHEGYARQKAIAWWKQRSRDGIPDTAQEAVDLANTGGVAFTREITVRSIAGDKHERIIDYVIDPLPEPEWSESVEDYDPALVPF
jgi:DNA repair protein RadD